MPESKNLWFGYPATPPIVLPALSGYIAQNGDQAKPDPITGMLIPSAVPPQGQEAFGRRNAGAA